MEQKLVRWRWRPGNPDTRFISPCKKPWVLPGADNTDMAIDEPEFLPFRAAMNATAWGHQLGLPLSSMPPNAGPSQPSLSMLAPPWDSPPLSLETAPSPLEHACMDEQLDDVATTEPQPIPATSWQPSPQPTATDATAAHFLALQHFTSDLGIQGIHDKGPITTLKKAQWLVVLLSGPVDEHPPHLNTTTNGPIIVAYNHYSNMLVESSIWFHLLLARREQLARTQQYIQDLMTHNWDGEDELELDEDSL
ncbi:hypothetical protein BKA82DRAFT_4019505 [Pisolithus tinctorius]|nr:hypothetical protein BKA82DRAFT_4019505 [Pisolithus tinctorius]